MSAREYFERAAASWDEAVGDAGLATLRAVLASLNLPDGADVLDWGAGTGLLLPIIAEIIGPHGSIVALDASAAMLHQAMSRCPVQDVRFVVADAAHTGLPSASFDAVLCIRAFPHFPDKAAALRAAARLLRADGLGAIVHAEGGEEVKPGHARLDRSVAHHPLPPRAAMET